MFNLFTKEMTLETLKQSKYYEPVPQVTVFELFNERNGVLPAAWETLI